MQKILCLFLIIFFLSNCNQSQQSLTDADSIKDGTSTSEAKNPQYSAKEATFVHTVFFWMKEDLTPEEATFFEEGMEKLGKTPSILSYKWGKPAGTPRDVVDNSYTYAWIVDFASKEDQDAYQDDPIHLKFIDESKHLWTKVQVYDTILK